MSDKGLQRIFKAESEAQKTIDEARQKNRDLIKKTQDEAQRDIENIKKTHEAEFQKQKQIVMEETEDYKAKTKSATIQGIAEIDTLAKNNSNKVADMLIGVVTSVDIKKRSEING